MACALTAGMTLDCRDAIGGITTVYIVEKANVGTITASSGTITAITMLNSAKFWTYSFRDETGEWTDELMTSDANGTQFSEQTLTFPTFKMSATKRNQIKLLAQNQLCIMVTVNNDINGTATFLMGEGIGATLQNTKGTSGKLRGDMNGYTLSFKAREAQQAQVVTNGIIAAIVQ